MIINVNGQEMRLLKSTSESAQSGQGSLASIGNQPERTTQPSQPTFPVDNGIIWLPPAEPETIGRGSLPASSSAAVQSADGTVRGRLLQKGHPLVNCYVVIVPVPKDDKADASLIGREPLTTTTNDEGVYCFEHVPAGEYKLIWLPTGSKQWIRRIAMRPDVIVHDGQDVTVKDIRMGVSRRSTEATHDGGEQSLQWQNSRSRLGLTPQKSSNKPDPSRFSRPKVYPAQLSSSCLLGTLSRLRGRQMAVAPPVSQRHKPCADHQNLAGAEYAQRHQHAFGEAVRVQAHA